MSEQNIHELIQFAELVIGIIGFCFFFWVTNRH